MSDDADNAQPVIDAVIADGSDACRRKQSMIPMGACYNCGDPVPQHHVFCCAECSMDFAQRMKMERINGRA
jgi:hypothetical protein